MIMTPERPNLTRFLSDRPRSQPGPAHLCNLFNTATFTLQCATLSISRCKCNTQRFPVSTSCATQLHCAVFGVVISDFWTDHITWTTQEKTAVAPEDNNVCLIAVPLRCTYDKRIWASTRDITLQRISEFDAVLSLDSQPIAAQRSDPVPLFCT